MKVNLFPFEHLEGQKAELRQKLQLPAEVKLDLAFDVVHGLNDLTRSLAGLHPHKMSIAVLGPQPSPLREVVKGFAGQGYAVQELPVSLLKFDEENLKKSFEALKKDTLFILCSAVEPLTGAIYPYEWVRKEAPKKNIFSVIYMSPDALQRGMIIPSTPFEGVVADPLWGNEHQLSVVIKGERCQGDRLFWGEPHFSDESLGLLGERLMAIRDGKSSNKEDHDFIKKIETQVAAQAGGVHLIGEDCRRLYDRAVFFFDGANGEALSHALKRSGFDTSTAAACAWNSPHMNHWLPKMGIREELVQGSLIVPLETLKKPALVQSLIHAVADLRKISGS